MQTSPFFDFKFGWQRGEDGWNTGMDDNIVKIGAMLKRDITGFVTVLPAIDIGEIYLHTVDKKLYYNVGGQIYSVDAPAWASYFVNGQQYIWDGDTTTETEVITTDEVGVTGAALMRSDTPTEGRSVLGLGTMATHDVSEFEDAIITSTPDNYLNGEKNWVNFKDAVRGVSLAGLALTSGQLASTDTILQAMGKLQFQMNLKASVASPAFSGSPTAPTAAVGDNSLTLANTAWVAAALSVKAPLASPALTGTPTAPTAVLGTSTSQIATTAFVQAAVNAIASSSVDSSKISNFTAAVGGNYWVRQDLTVTLPTEIGRTIGDRVTLGKKISATLTITTSNGTTPIVTARGSDPVVIFDINATLIFVFNGTNWEV